MCHRSLRSGLLVLRGSELRIAGPKRRMDAVDQETGDQSERTSQERFPAAEATTGTWKNPDGRNRRRLELLPGAVGIESSHRARDVGGVGVQVPLVTATRTIHGEQKY